MASYVLMSTQITDRHSRVGARVVGIAIYLFVTVIPHEVQAAIIAKSPKLTVYYNLRTPKHVFQSMF